jgi:hypothetical protein
MKICAKCKVLKPYSEFHKLIRASDGLNYRCKDCCNKYYNSIYTKIKEDKISKSKDYYLNNKEKIAERQKNHRINNIDLYKKKKQQYNSLNKEQKLEYNKKYVKQKRESDPYFRFICHVRKLCYRAFIKKDDTTNKLLGYNPKDLFNKLGRYPIKGEHIDHKIPVTWFIIETPIYIISHLDNLQILSQNDNVSKNNRYADPVLYSYYEKALPYIIDKYKDKIKQL